MNNEVFGKPIENVGKNRDIKFVTRKIRNYQLVSEPNYHSASFFHRISISNRNEKKHKYL